MRQFRPQIEKLEDRTVMDANSASALGIDARNLMASNGTLLTGAGIAIGQVEVEPRPKAIPVKAQNAGRLEMNAEEPVGGTP